MANAYWDRYWSRRNLLRNAAAAGSGVAALGLVGCGGSSNSVSSLATPTPKASASPTVVDPFANVKRGGTYSVSAAGDAPTIDPMGNTSFQTRTFATYVYSRLYRFKTGPGFGAGDVVPEGDLVQTAETTPDGLKWTLKLKNAKFHNVAPVNGRNVTSDDIKYSWGRLVDPKNAASANVDFVDKLEYPDASTVVFTLKSPSAGFKDTFTDTSNLIIMPTESDGKFDPKTQMIGSGPWLLSSYTPSQGIKFKRNPDWFDKGPQNFPLMDAVDVAIIPDYPNSLTQFRSGSLDAFGPQATDLVDIKTQSPNVGLYGYVSPQESMFYMDSDPTSPWVSDPRVRQAISMSASRDQITDLMYNTTKLKAGGIDVSAPWNNVIPAGMKRWWLDPQSSDMGTSAQYYKYDVAAAKALLSAAGFPNGFSTTFQYAGAIYGKAFDDSAQAYNAFLNAIGIKTTVDVQDYSSKYITQTSIGNFKGIAYGPETGFTDVGAYPTRWFTNNPKNRSRINDPDLIKMTAAQQAELDDTKRKSILWDIQRLASEKMYYPPAQYGAGTVWGASQPWLQNALTFVTNGYGGGTEVAPYRWKTN